jgi:Holliday junction resolvase RusA-like endonuclease
LRLYTPANGSDLDNYVKPIQDALAKHGVFGETAFVGSSMRGDEHVDHLELRRKRVESPKEAGVLAEVWALKA